MNLPAIWSTLEAGYDCLGDYGYPAMDQAAAELGLASGWFSWVAALMLCHAEPFTVGQFMQLFPYGLARLNAERLAIGVQQDALAVNSAGAYQATQAGLAAVQQIVAAMDASIARFQPAPGGSLQRLLDLLYRLAEVSFAAPEPPAHPLLAHKRNLRRLPATEDIQYFVRYYSELAGFRDDMYVAAWQAHQVEGHAWEAFDQLVQAGALSFDELYARLSRRGLPKEVYIQDLQEIAAHGWVEDTPEGYQPSAEGRRVRQEVEELTAQAFFAPWVCLSQAEQEELTRLAGQFLEHLNAQQKAMAGS